MDPRLERLRRGQGPLYVATFLFEHTGRYYGSRLERACLQGLREGLEALGWRVEIARRYEAGSAEGLRAGAEQDFRNALTSEVVLTFGDGPDMNPESAALQGYLRALGREVVLYCSSATRLYTGSEYDMRRNLMLMHSADRMVPRLADLAEAVGFPGPEGRE